MIIQKLYLNNNLVKEENRFISLIKSSTIDLDNKDGFIKLNQLDKVVILIDHKIDSDQLFTILALENYTKINQEKKLFYLNSNFVPNDILNNRSISVKAYEFASILDLDNTNSSIEINDKFPEFLIICSKNKEILNNFETQSFNKNERVLIHRIATLEEKYQLLKSDYNRLSADYETIKSSLEGNKIENLREIDWYKDQVNYYKEETEKIKNWANNEIEKIISDNTPFYYRILRALKNKILK